MTRPGEGSARHDVAELVANIRRERNQPGRDLVLDLVGAQPEDRDAAIHAEAIAIGRAITETGDRGIETIVAVRHPKPGEPGKIAVVSPCGICRELIHDYDANARVIVPDNGRAPKVVSIGELLPNKYKRGSE